MFLHGWETTRCRRWASAPAYRLPTGFGSCWQPSVGQGLPCSTWTWGGPFLTWRRWGACFRASAAWRAGQTPSGPPCNGLPPCAGSSSGARPG